MRRSAAAYRMGPLRNRRFRMDEPTPVYLISAPNGTFNGTSIKHHFIISLSKYYLIIYLVCPLIIAAKWKIRFREFDLRTYQMTNQINH